MEAKGVIMAHEHNDQCETLQDALATARASQTLPMRDTAVSGIQGVEVLDPGDIAPSADPELAHEIRNMEQELRDMGCEPR
jgi:hypothetical protein